MNEKRCGRRFEKGFLLFLAQKAGECKQKLRSVQAVLPLLHKKSTSGSSAELPDVRTAEDRFLTG